MLCVVEGPGDQLAIEKSKALQGRYHVLQGVLSPLDGIGVEDLRVSELMSRLKTENIKEIILALNPTVEGEATASYLTDLLRDKDMAIYSMSEAAVSQSNKRLREKISRDRKLKSILSKVKSILNVDRLTPFPLN